MSSWSNIARRVRVPLGFAFAAFYLWLARPMWISIVAGSAIAVLGLVVRALASGHVRKNQELTTTGPYGYTRNPLYLGSLIIACGFAVAGWNWWITGAMVVMFVVIYVPVIRGEEAFLQQQFPEFEEYASAVPRIVPSLRPWKKSHIAFSRDLYFQHREYQALLGALAMVTALIVKMIVIK